MEAYVRVEIPSGILNLVWAAQEYASEVSKLLNIGHPMTVHPYAGFAMVRNRLVLTLEVLNWYHALWAEGQRGVSLDKLEQGIMEVEPRPADDIRKDNQERVMEVLKSLYTLSMSSIEYSAKQTINLYPSHPILQLPSKSSDIVRESAHSGLIDPVANAEWQDLIFVRNCAVHNNCISDRDVTINVEGMKITVSKNHMIRGKLDIFAVLTRAALRRYRDWAVAIISTS